MIFKIYPALHEDINSGWVWLGKRECSQRAVVKIKNRVAKKSIYCEALEIDGNFVKKYKEKTGKLIDSPENVLIINEWYRKRLGNLELKQEYDLEIYYEVDFPGRVRAVMQHPQEAIRIASWLALASILIGVFGLAISLISLIL